MCIHGPCTLDRVVTTAVMPEGPSAKDLADPCPGDYAGNSGII